MPKPTNKLTWSNASECTIRSQPHKNFTVLLEEFHAISIKTASTSHPCIMYTRNTPKVISLICMPIFRPFCRITSTFIVPAFTHQFLCIPSNCFLFHHPRPVSPHTNIWPLHVHSHLLVLILMLWRFRFITIIQYLNTMSITIVIMTIVIIQIHSSSTSLPHPSHREKTHDGRPRSKLCLSLTFTRRKPQWKVPKTPKILTLFQFHPRKTAQRNPMKCPPTSLILTPQTTTLIHLIILIDIKTVRAKSPERARTCTSTITIDMLLIGKNKGKLGIQLGFLGRVRKIFICLRNQIQGLPS
uniref:Uncharacterized protein n=1 Tax=Opuntia streptacantha TaxID=393608 RepID=A0A7C9A1P5_OPUST